MKEELNSSFMSVPIYVIDTSSVESGRTTDDSMDLYEMEILGKELLSM